MLWMLRNLRIRQRINHLWQRLIRGFDDSDTWHLDVVIARFALPRLKRFKELNNGFPGDSTPENWAAEIDDMIYSLNAIVEMERETSYEVDSDRFYRGLTLFGMRFRELWW